MQFSIITPNFYNEKNKNKLIYPKINFRELIMCIFFFQAFFKIKKIK